MEGSDSLHTIAEVALGLAGFSAVVAAFTRPAGLAPADRWRFLVLFGIAIQALLLSFVPMVLHHAGVSETATWRASSALFAATWLITGALISRSLSDRWAMDPQPTIAGALPVFVPGVTNLFLQVANAAGWPAQPNFACYLAGLLILLYLGAYFFAFLVLYRPQS